MISNLSNTPARVSHSLLIPSHVCATSFPLAALLVGLFSAGAQMFTSVSRSDVLLLVLVIVFIQFRPRGIVFKRSRALKEA